MPDWLSHPHALFVIAAYGVTAAGLIGLLFFSWREWRARQKEWRRLQDEK